MSKSDPPSWTLAGAPQHRLFQPEAQVVPKQRQQQHHQEAEEGPLIPQANAVVDPWTVVVQSADAPPALLAMVRPRLPHRAAHDADLLEGPLAQQLDVLCAIPVATKALGTRLVRNIGCPPSRSETGSNGPQSS